MIVAFGRIGSFFTDRHLVVALLVAPVLAILAWVAVDAMVGERRQKASPGASYPLLAQSDCRRHGGICRLHNEEFQLTIEYTADGTLSLSSAHPLEGVLIASGVAPANAPPKAMIAADDSARNWRLYWGKKLQKGERLRLVASASGSRYFADFAAAFLFHDQTQRTP